ncbi:MAG TPA: hypothetical protein VM943_05570, partial [Pyrinomonadaceae bacterium]|nr:hypothetical protein [Pyrinomonadaceae bacterium]
SILLTFVLVTLQPGIAATGTASSEAEARGAITQAFEQLRAGDYGAVYDALPSASQRRISRERFVGALRRTRERVELDRMDVAAVRVAGDLAMVDTIVYGRVMRPIEGEGKIVSRQYLVREGGRWRVTTGDNSTVRPLLTTNPQFARRFPPTEPRIYLKRDGRWIDLSAQAPKGGARR